MTGSGLRSHDWSLLTRAEIGAARDAGALVILPVGATEQHADFLPVRTDIHLSREVSLAAAARASAVPVLVAPGIPFGFSPHHLSFAGTISLRLETFMAVVRDAAMSILDSGFPRVLIVNGHGGNDAPARALIGQMVTDGHPVGYVDYFVPGLAEVVPNLKGGLARVGHACEAEVALTLALAEDPSERSRIETGIKGLPPRLVQPWIPLGRNSDPLTEAGGAWPPIFQADDCGYYGDPGAATTADGTAHLETVIAALARYLDAFAATPLRLGIARAAAAPHFTPVMGKPGTGAAE